MMLRSGGRNFTRDENVPTVRMISEGIWSEVFVDEAFEVSRRVFSSELSDGASDDSPEGRNNAATTEHVPIDQLINATAGLKSDFSRDSDAAAASDAAKCDSRFKDVDKVSAANPNNNSPGYYSP